jgi:molybdopterin/thiamine biosynthesis adenylyltransferase
MVEAALARHHRTALLLATLAELDSTAAAKLLDNLAFDVSIDAALAQTRHGQATLLTAVNVLARSGGALALEVPQAELLLPGLPWLGTLDSVAGQLATWAGARTTGVTTSEGVHVGGTAQRGRVLAQGDSWTAKIDTPGAAGIGDSDLALGAVTAGHLAAARAFHIALARRLNLPAVSRDPLAFSLLYGPVPSLLMPAAVGEFTLVGAGAVGNALLWALLVGGVRIDGEVVIFDPQQLDASNLNRHLLAGVPDVGRPKSEIVAEFADGVAATRARTERFVAPAAPPSVIVSTVDNNEARYEAQAAFPRVMLHGATGGENVAVAALDFTNGACLGCLFPRPQYSHAERIAEESGLDLSLVARVLADDAPVTYSMVEVIAPRLGVEPGDLAHLIGRNLREVYAKDLCGRLPTGLGAGAPVATIAYASGLAGVLLAAELLKISDPALAPARLSNYLQLSAVDTDAAWRTFREKQDDCPLMCGSPALQSAVRKVRGQSPRP